MTTVGGTKAVLPRICGQAWISDGGRSAGWKFARLPRHPVMGWALHHKTPDGRVGPSPSFATAIPRAGVRMRLGLQPQRCRVWLGQTDGRGTKETLMAKGMSKPGKNVKKPKKEKAKPAVLTASTKGAVVINGGKSKD